MLTPKLPQFLRQQFEKKLEKVLKDHQYTGLRLVQPICLNRTGTADSASDLWILLIAIYDCASEKKDAVIFMVDPTGNDKEVDIDVNPLMQYQHTDILMQSVVSSVMDGFRKANISIGRFLLSGLRQVALHQIENSGPVFIANLQAIMNQQQLDSQILQKIDNLILEQRSILSAIKAEENVRIKTVPFEVNDTVDDHIPVKNNTNQISQSAMRVSQVGKFRSTTQDTTSTQPTEGRTCCIQ